ncbi:MAG TPA: TonB-dependent receptor [Longimicrobiales bacterium]
MAARSSRLAWPGLIAFALLALAGPAAAQSGKLTGIVTDAATGAPLAGVQITLEGTGRSVLTQDNGRYFIINVPPGVYTVSAQLIGYATVRRENVQVSIDVTHTVDFALPSQALAVEGVVVEAERVPLITLDRTGAGETLTSLYLEALPVSDVTDALELQAGFLQVPQNTEVVAYAEERRGVTPLRIRGGRGAETLTLIDGIPVNNFVLGGPAIDLTTEAVEQIDFKRGGFEPQYGNALSGIIDIATKEGGTELSGAVDFRTSAVGAWLGNALDEVRDWNQFSGFISGPVPGTAERLRFMFSGQQSYGPDRVLEFDDDVFDPTSTTTRPNTPFQLDIVPGWRSFGYDVGRNLFGKVTFYANPAAKLSASWLRYERQTRTFDFDWMWAGFDPLTAAKTVEDSTYFSGANGYWLNFKYLVQGSISQERDLYVLRWDHTLGKSAYQIALGRFDQKRVTCNWAQGVCLGDEFEDPNFAGGFVDPGAEFTRGPTVGTDFFYGGETIETWVARADFQSQVTDHHNIRAGVFFQRHDVLYDEWECSCVNAPDKLRNFWSAEPWDAAFYVQDKIEYDFITVDLGFRFDYGRAEAKFFTNPLDPTNGTTALTVCADPNAFPTIPAEAQQELQNLGQSLEWLRNNCGDPDARRVAAIIAAQDDFSEAKPRRQFSPRIGVSFPVTESSNLFFNFGRYSQNPILKNLYWYTGAGTPNEGTPKALDLNAFEYSMPFLGNPSLAIETTNAYEIGYRAEIGTNYALSAIAFAKDQSGLTGVRLVGQNPFPVFDPGVTYGSPSPQYLILVNGDFATVRGFEVSLRRQIADYWGFDLNYSWSRARINAADPERQRERVDNEDEQFILFEYPSEVDQPHVFRGVLRFAVLDEAPEALGALGGLVRNSNLSITVRAESGLPYTPITSGFGLSNAEARQTINSGRAPFTWRIDLRAQKSIDIGNVRYQLYADVFNLLDRKNCIQVFNTTGHCLAGTEDQDRRQAGGGFTRNGASTYFDRPDFVGQRRTIEAGIRVSF